MTKTLTNNEVLQVIEEVGKEVNFSKAKQSLVKLVLDTGMRLNEALNLQWKDIEKQSGCASITFKNKNNETSHVFINQELYNELLETKSDSDNVFGKLNTKTMRDMLRRIKETLNMTELNFHLLRSTYISKMCKSFLNK